MATIGPPESDDPINLARAEDRCGDTARVAGTAASFCARFVVARSGRPRPPQNDETAPRRGFVDDGRGGVRTWHLSREARPAIWRPPPSAGPTILICSALPCRGGELPIAAICPFVAIS